METKMKKIPFDLERAKKGEAFRMPYNNCDFFYLSNFGNQYHCKHKDHETGGWQASLYNYMDTWFHLIPDEPKPERWATVHKNRIFNSEQEAKDSLFQSWENVVVVKLADDEA